MAENDARLNVGIEYQGEGETQRLEDDLRQLMATEDRYQRQVREGVEISEKAERASQDRREQIDSVARELAEQEDAQTRVNRQTRELVDSHRKVRDAGNELTDSTKGVNTGFAGMITNVTNLIPLLAGTAGVAGALSLVKQRYEELLNAQQESARANIDLASAQRDVRFNLFGDQDRFDDANRISQEISEETGVRQPTVLQAIGSAYSAAGGDFDAATNRVRLATRARANRPGSIAPLAAAIGDIAGAIPGATDEQALGALLTTGGLVRPDDPNQLFQNAPPGIRALVSLGFAPREAIALYGSLTTASTDTTGATSSTAAANFADQFSTFLGEQGIEARGFEAIRAVQEQGLGGEFFENLSIETRSRDFFRGLFVRGQGSAEFQSIQRNLESVPGLEQLGQNAAQFLNDLESGDAEQVAAAERQLQTTRERMLAMDPEGAMAAVLREELPELLIAAGEPSLLSGLTQSLSDATTDMGRVNALGRAIDRIRIRRQMLSMGRIEGPGLFSGSIGGPSFTGPSDLDRRRQDQLDEAIEALERIQQRFREETEIDGEEMSSIGRPEIHNHYHGPTYNQTGDPFIQNAMQGIVNA